VLKKLFFFILLIAYVIAFAANKLLDKSVGFDYDMTLAYSRPTFEAEKKEEPSERIDWTLVNGRLLSAEKRKRAAWLVPLSKIFGYTPIVVTARPEIKGALFRAHVQRVYGIKPEDVYMTRDKSAVLAKRNVTVFFGDSDGDITEAQEAGIRAIRIRRADDDPYKENYNPGKYGEFVLPFSADHD